MCNKREKLSQEQDVLGWSHLARHFAFGRLFLVAKDIDLLDVALSIADDRVELLRRWMEEGQFGAPSSEQVEGWTPETKFKVNIVSPYVLIQQLS